MNITIERDGGRERMRRERGEVRCELDVELKKRVYWWHNIVSVEGREVSRATEGIYTTRGKKSRTHMVPGDSSSNFALSAFVGSSG